LSGPKTTKMIILKKSMNEIGKKQWNWKQKRKNKEKKERNEIEKIKRAHVHMNSMLVYTSYNQSVS
jgi:hypothetical protein